MTPAARTNLARLIAQLLYERHVAKTSRPPVTVATPQKQAQNPAA